MLKWNSPPVTDIDDQGLPQSAMVYQGLIISLVTIRTAQYFLSMCFNYIQTSEHLKFGMILPVLIHAFWTVRYIVRYIITCDILFHVMVILLHEVASCFF